ncbi:MAG: precorrin-6y C5,15-methyltransferase (decarboxylating) subunit CbiE [Selenomonadaceae bacterium]|nr:precorrin-6y C5,15-methyltransferase (decarboxylating) subunit CbiE [Selenomonadaceae bacterium]
MENKIVVAGIGPGNEDFITPAALKKIRAAKFLVGGRRALSEFAKENQITCAITRDLDTPINFIREKILLGEVVVMVSGDPGYYSMLDLLRKKFPPSMIEVIPSISAMQLAFAKIALSWHDATLLSFHGRQPARAALEYSAGKILGLLTDAEFNSATISKILLDCGWDKNSSVTICEKLSYPDEKISTITLDAAANAEPIKHCVLIVNGYNDSRGDF